MRKFLALLSLAVLGCVTAVAQSVDLSQYSLILSGNATIDGGDHTYLGAIIGGNLTLGGDTDFTRSTNTGITFVGGTVTSNGNQIGLFTQPYYFANASGSLNLQNPGASYSSAPFDPSNIFTTLASDSTTYAGLSNNASYAISGSTMNITSAASNGVLNLSLNSSALSSFFSGNNLAINFSGATGSQLIINVAGSGSAFSFNAQTLGIGKAANILWNFTNIPTLTIGNSASTFNGTILATGSTINWQANDLNGQLIASNLIDKSAHEYHNVPFFASDVNCPIPEPYTYALCSLLLCMALLFARRRLCRIFTQKLC